MFTLFSAIIYIALLVADDFVGNKALSSIYTAATLLPTFAVTVRRLHDTDRSGWLILVGLIPLIGAFVLLAFMANEGTPGQNKHGVNPKENLVLA